MLVKMMIITIIHAEVIKKINSFQYHQFKPGLETFEQ